MVERRHSREPNVASTTIDIIDSLQVRGKGDFGKSADSLLDSLVSESISLDSYLEQCGNLLGLAFHSSTDDVQFVEQREQPNPQQPLKLATTAEGMGYLKKELCLKSIEEPHNPNPLLHGVLEKVFSCPPTPTHWSLLFLCECLGAAGPRSLPYVKFAVRLLMDRVGEDSLERDLRAGMNEEGKELSPRDAKRLSVSLCRLPQRVGNVLQKLAPAILFPGELFPSICRALVRATIVICPSTPNPTTSNGLHSSSVHYLWIALSSQLILAGRAKDLASCLLHSVVNGELTSQRHSDLVESLPLDSASDLVSELICCAAQEFSLHRDPIGNVIEIEVEAGEKEQSPYCNCWIRALVDGVSMLVKEGGADGRLFHLLTQRMILAVSFPPPHLKGVVVALVGVLSGSELLLEELVFGLGCQTQISVGLLETASYEKHSSHLSLFTSYSRFRQGLLVGETVSHIVGEPISFDELRSMERKEKELEKNKVSAALTVSDVDDVSNSVELREEVVKQQCNACEPDWDDPDCVLLPLRVPPRDSETIAPVIEKKKYSSEENIDDLEETELLPYDPPLPRKSKLPQYLHHIISRLEVTLDNDSWDDQKSALVALPIVISRNPPDLQAYCSRLLRDLLFLEDRFGIPDFEELRVEGMVAVSFSEPCTAVGSKYLILHVLVATAKRLSKIANRAIVKCTATRKQVELWGHADSAPLLAKVLGALSCFMECTSTGYAAETLGKDVAWFAWAFRYSLHADLRAAVVVAISTVAAISPRALEAVGLGEAECQKWLKEIERDINEGSAVTKRETMPLLRRNLLPAEFNQIQL